MGDEAKAVSVELKLTADALLSRIWYSEGDWGGVPLSGLPSEFEVYSISVDYETRSVLSLTLRPRGTAEAEKARQIEQVARRG